MSLEREHGERATRGSTRVPAGLSPAAGPKPLAAAAPGTVPAGA